MSKLWKENKGMKKKIIVTIIIFAFLLTGCASTVLPVTNKNSTSNKSITLGNDDYVKKIQGIARKSGNKTALAEIMIDVDTNGSDLDQKDTNNLSRFHKLVSSLISKIGYVDMETHYFRNKLNRGPKNLQALISLNKSLPINRRWILLSVKGSSYHIQGVDGEYNLKFVSYDGFCEAVYNKKGVLLDENNDPINMGTYNYAAGIHSINAHGTYDVAPYLIWGNTPNSTQKGRGDILIGINLAAANYKKNSASVYIYRKSLFGVQQGRVQ